MGRIPKVNVHCHFLHFNHLPDEYTRYMIKKASTFSVSESWIEEKLSKLVKNRTGAFANSLKDDSIWGRMGVVDNYIKKGEYLIEKDLEKEKIPDDNDDRYDIITPLMMDMINATNLMEAGRKISEEEGEKKVMPHHRLYNKDGVIPYTMQVLEYSYFASKYPYQILPFVNFNPLRYKCLDLCKDAVVNYGFVGVKLYPCLGFYPFKHSKNDKISE
ncbi:MAG: hypothetical protein JXB50_14780, partial [Spirochaetes bacterium]|nr:hypothetical protein [Spirochaetota bacterium]